MKAFIKLCFCACLFLGCLFCAQAEFITKVVYFKPTNVRVDLTAKIQKIVEDTQELYAGEMERNGFERKTFRVETRLGKPRVHIVNGKRNSAHYIHNTFEKVRPELPNFLNQDTEPWDKQDMIVVIVVGGIACLDEVQGGWCGWGVGWPFHSLRYGGGVVIAANSGHFNKEVLFHEMGHAFGLYHKPAGTEEDDVLELYEARWLDKHYHFNNRTNNFTYPETLNRKPKLTILEDSTVKFEIEAVSNEGLHQAQIIRKDDIQVLAWDYMNGDNRNTVSFEINRRKLHSNVILQIMDTRGNHMMIDMVLDIPDVIAGAVPADMDTTNACVNLLGPGELPVKLVSNESVNVMNDYDTLVEEDNSEGVTYLALIGGSSPTPNACGLTPKNPNHQWTGWGGPVDTDNATIGEGPGMRNRIIVGGTYFQRGIGVHAPARLVYDLTGADYVNFQGYIGISDETDPSVCQEGGTSKFIFNIDGHTVFDSGIVAGRSGASQVEAIKVEFEIPSNARELEIVITDAGDGLCADHATIGDPKLSTEQKIDNGTSSSAMVSLLPISVQSPNIGQMLKLSLKIANGENVAGYQATVSFDTIALRYVSSTNGDFLPAGAFFVEPTVEGNLVKLNAASLAGEINGDGTLATLTFEVVAVKASILTLSDVLLTNGAGETFVPQVENAEITESTGFKEDINGDGTVNIADLVLVASSLGKTSQTADVNGDGVVNIADLVLVAGALGNSTAAPSLHLQVLEILTATDVKRWLSQAQQLDLTDTKAQRGILFLHQLLVALTPKETALLPNYPNPFNPETWIPYRLAKDAEVTLTIYATDGYIVRRLALGHQPAGLYENRSRAAYWDGRNQFGEPVASGIYFYTLTAGDFTATRRMLIVK